MIDEPDDTREQEELEDESEELLTLEDVCTKVGPDEEVPYMPFGVIVHRDCTVYVLNAPWYHGVVLALLEPEKTKAAGWDAPRRHCDVYKYQRLQFAISRECDYIYVASGIFGYNVSRATAPASKAQALRVVKLLVGDGATGETEVTTDIGPMPLNNLEKFLLAKDMYNARTL